MFFTSFCAISKSIYNMSWVIEKISLLGTIIWTISCTGTVFCWTICCVYTFSFCCAIFSYICSKVSLTSDNFFFDFFPLLFSFIPRFAHSCTFLATISASSYVRVNSRKLLCDFILFLWPISYRIILFIDIFSIYAKFVCISKSGISPPPSSSCVGTFASFCTPPLVSFFYVPSFLTSKWSFPSTEGCFARYQIYKICRT
jgi:hypothetical protein